jgi:hypothetical protein
MFFTVMTFLMTNRALARDVSHYPYDDFAYSGKYLRTFVNDKTGTALALHVDFDFSDVQNDLLKKALATLAERYISKMQSFATQGSLMWAIKRDKEAGHSYGKIGKKLVDMSTLKTQPPSPS